MAGGDAERYIEIAGLAAFTVAFLCFVAWLLRLSVIVRLISDSILVGFKAGAGLTIIMTQLPALFGVPGGGQNFLERGFLLVGQLDQTHYLVLALGATAIVVLLLGEPAVLERQVKRMIADPRAHALVENFFGQWLMLRNMNSLDPGSDGVPIVR